MKILIICKGSSQIGLGHLIRAHSFAVMASQKHVVRIVAVVEPQFEKVFNGISKITTCTQNELDIIDIVKSHRFDIILYDCVTIEKVVLDALRKKTIISASLSPIFSYPEYIDALITRNPDQVPIPGVEVFNGYEYAIFKENCYKIKDQDYAKNIDEDILPVAICMGGGDAANKTLLVLKSLLRIKCSCIFWVLLGEGYQHSYQDLVNVSRKFNNHEVILAKTNRSMWRVMGNCALAILAGGLTTAEAVFAGLPTINIFEVEDHKNIMVDLINRGACIDGGLFSKSSIERNVKLVEEMYVNRQILIKMRSSCNGIYDDKGGERILSSLYRLFKSKIDSNGIDKHYNPNYFHTSQYIYGK